MCTSHCDLRRMIRLSQLRGTAQVVLTQARRETLQHLRRFFLVAWLIWCVEARSSPDRLRDQAKHRGLRCIVLIVDKADRLGWNAASCVCAEVMCWPPTRMMHRPHKLALTHQATYVVCTTCIGVALEIWGSYLLLHLWSTPRYAERPGRSLRQGVSSSTTGERSLCNGSRCWCTST